MQIPNTQLSNGENSSATAYFYGKVVLLRLKQVQERIGLGRSSIYALADKNSRFYDPSFPRNIKISAHAVGWIESEIDAWLITKIEATRQTKQ